jgi:hypothetical protein
MLRVWVYQIVVCTSANDAETLDEFGSRGWELVAVMPAGDNGARFYFKKTS